MRSLIVSALAFLGGLLVAQLLGGGEPSAEERVTPAVLAEGRPATLSTSGERRGPSLAARPRAVDAPAAAAELAPPRTRNLSVAGSAPSTVGAGGSPAGAAPRGGEARRSPVRAIDPRLQSALDGEVARALASAERASSGRAGANDCRVAFQVVDLHSGTIVAERAPGAWMEPASNLKLVTTLAALVALGPDWRFRTPVEAHGELRGGVLTGDLVVRAGGDPLYAPDDPGLAGRRLEALARELAAGGLRRVTGDLVLELGAFPEPGPAPGWPDSNASWTGSYAFVSGLTANGGIVRLDFAAQGSETRVRIAPEPNGLDHSGRVGAVGRSENDVRVGLYDSSLALTVGGTLGPPGREFSSEVRHPRPGAMFGALFANALERAGIAVEGVTREARGLAPGRELAALETPWVDLLVPINRDSVNGVADAVFLAIGLARKGQPTRAAARAAVAEVLEELGLATAGFAQVGGSGLSRDNRVSPELLVELLSRVDAGPAEVRERLLASLAVAGTSGTLEQRMLGTPAQGRVRAKTGFIVGASALSGYADALDGGRYAFSVLVGYPRLGGLNNTVWKPMHDAIAVHLVERRR